MTPRQKTAYAHPIAFAEKDKAVHSRHIKSTHDGGLVYGSILTLNK